MRYTKVTIVFRPPFLPSYFIGSQIRGALGYALKRVTCISPSYKCEDCFAIDTCLYYKFYEQKNSFHQYRLDYELGSDYYHFSIYLFEQTAQQLPYIISALDMMLTKNGLTKNRHKIENYELFVNDSSCRKNGRFILPEKYIKTFQIDKISSNVVLKFKTPLRMKKENKFARTNNLELQNIVNSIYQRQMKLLGKEYKKVPYDIQGEVVEKELYHKELSRRSNRQQTTMQLGGIMGEMKLQNLNKETFEVLKVGELIGVGKQTVFGLGKIIVEQNNE